MWQPIETAPRDATAILVMRDICPGARSGRAEECNGRNTYVAAWWPDERGGQGAWICYMDAVLDPECPVEPTHWMPLPDPPGAQPQLNEIKINLQRALELGARETWTGARKPRSWEDQREEQQCWNKVWSLLGAQGEEK